MEKRKRVCVFAGVNQGPRPPVAELVQLVVFRRESYRTCGGVEEHVVCFVEDLGRNVQGDGLEGRTVTVCRGAGAGVCVGEDPIDEHFGLWEALR